MKCKNLEWELWNLTMKGEEIATYASQINDIETICSVFITSKYKKIERHIHGLA